MSSKRHVVLALSLLSTACFDTEEVDVARTLKVDDFEDGDEVASPASGFSDWYCSSFSTPPDQEPSPMRGLTPGFESAFAESLTFSLTELPNVDYPGTLLGTSSAFGTLDLSAFTSLHFKSKFEPGNPAPRDGTRLGVELVCPLAETAADLTPGTRYYDRQDQKEGVELTRDWSSNALPLAQFIESWWHGSLVDEGTCLERVQNLQFLIDPELLNGETAAGTLMIDDVYLE